MDAEEAKAAAVIAAVGINLIWDIIDRVKERTGIELTPENLATYAANRKAVREKLNRELGVTG